MAVVPIRIADNYALCKGGRMQYQFQGAGRVATTGTAAVNGFLLGGEVIEGAKLNLLWNGHTTTLVAKKVPAAPNEFQSGVVNDGYVASLVDFLGSLFAIREDFSVAALSIPGPYYRLDLTAKQPGVAYNLAEASMPGIIAKNITAGADPVTRANYSVYVELWAQMPAEDKFRRIDHAFLEADDSNRYNYNPGDLLHDELMRPDLPVWNFPQPFSAKKSHCAYYVAYGEAYGNPRQPGRMYRTEIRHAYLGGADFLHRAGSGYELTSLTQQPGVGGTSLIKALRYGAPTRYVRADEPQFLTFVNTTGASVPSGGVQLEVKLIMTDDSQLTISDTYARIPFPDGEKLTFPVGVTQLGLLAKVPAGKTLREYSVQLIAVTDASPTYRYLLNTRHESFTRYFAYISSLGVIETLATFGKGSRELSLFYEQAERYLPATYDVADGQFVNYDVQLQEQTEVATGPRTAAELRGFLDFYRSSFRYHLRATQALPIGITSKSIKQQKDGENRLAHTFSYQYLFRDDFYTVSAEDGADQGDGVPPYGFTPAGGGSVIIAQPVLVPSVDNTVPNAVRTLSAEKINGFEQAVAQVKLLVDAKPLDQAVANQLYRRGDQPVPFADLSQTPTTRDGYNLSDVLTSYEVIDLVATKIKRYSQGVYPRIAVKSLADDLDLTQLD